jgi:ectoine hydroxylase-related dioxygenase (phytanoyl-CoA dioxygenase family)
VPPGDSGPGTPASVTRQNDYVSLQVAEIRSFLLNPAFGALAAALGQHEGLRLFHDQLISKAPGPAVVGWHTDRSYWLTCSSPEMLTIWVPLQDVDDRNGGLRVVDESHRLEIDHNTMRGFHNRTADGDPRAWPRSAVLPLAMRRGQVSVHHAKTIHGSGPNLGDHSRIALAIHLQPLDNHYIQPPADAPALHFNDVLCQRQADGRPDYSDPYVCPQLGRAKESDAT